MQRFQPLLKENIEYILAPKAFTQAPKAQAFWGAWGYAPPPQEILQI